MTSEPTPDPGVHERPTWASRQAGDGPEWVAWNWSRGSHGFSWMGVLLVLIGIALLVQRVQPTITFGTLILLALGLAFGAAWLLGGSRGALVPAAVLLALGLAGMSRELAYVTGSGWNEVFVGVALLITWVLGFVQHARREWALWVGGILALIGLAEVSDKIAGLPDLGALWPALIIALGLVLLVRARMGRRGWV